MDFISFYDISLLVAVAFCVYTWRISNKKKRQYPPVAGTIFHQLLNFNRLHDFNTDLCRKHKTFRLLAPFNRQIYTCDPANVEYILKTNFKNYGKGCLDEQAYICFISEAGNSPLSSGSYNYDNLSDLLGDGIFAVDGDKWKQQRKLASHEFSTRILRDYSSIVFKKKASELAQIIFEKANSKVGINIQDLFMKSTMDSIFKVGFGIELNVLHGSEEGTRFSNAFDNSSVQIVRRYVDPFWKIKRYLNVGYEAELKNEIQIVDDFVYKVIDVKIRNSSSHEYSPVKKEDLLSRFIMEMDKDPKNMTRKYLRDIILNFVVAGKDTTGGALSWFIYMLCKHPHIQEKAAGEVKEAVKNVGKTEFGEFVSYLNDETLDKMHYLHAAIAETLRLYPSVPLDSKVCFSNDTLPDGYGMNKGDILNYLPYAMGRMKTLWGEDAENFRPERWIDTKRLFQPESPFKFTAFQAGPRICLGKEFAYRQMKIFSAVLLNFFKFKLCDETEDVRYRTTVTLCIENGLNVYALQR